MVESTAQDAFLERIRRAQEAADDEEWCSQLAAARTGERSFLVRDGLVCRSRGGTQVSICVPSDVDLRRELMQMHHDAPTAGHLGLYRMVTSLSARYYWRGMHRDCRLYC